MSRNTPRAGLPARLLVLPCSARKRREPAWPIEAWWRYDGVLVRLCRALDRSGRFPRDVRVRFLSAEYGVILPTTPIPWYERRMDAPRAAALRPAVAAALDQAVRDERAAEVFMALGQRYRDAAVLFSPPVPVRSPVTSIGRMQRLLRSWLLAGRAPPSDQMALDLALLDGG